MWCLTSVESSFQLWFSDGQPINYPRGVSNVSPRLIVDTQGFLDLTEITIPSCTIIDANGSKLVLPTLWPHGLTGPLSPVIKLALKIEGKDSFELTLDASMEPDHIGAEFKGSNKSVTGKLKPLPDVAEHDAAILHAMIDAKYVPYQDIPDAPGKTVEEIKALSRRLFPFSPYSFELAMCVYDWTTASFARLVFLKIFQYTAIEETPFSLDQPSIAQMIFASNWGPYTPQNPVYMNSFMMIPASSVQDVQIQLKTVAPKLHVFSEVQNRLVSAAMQAMPRTSRFTHAQLFSGQLDIYQLHLDHFGIEFLECPLNAGPVDQPLILAFATVLASYVSTGKTITTKMVWSFTDTMEDAIHYSNGIVLVANYPQGSWLWETASYITPLSDDPAKTEYTFPPGCQFKVLSVDTASYHDKPIVVITIQPIHDAQQGTVDQLDVPEEVKRESPAHVTGEEAVRLFEEAAPALESRIQSTTASLVSLEKALDIEAAEISRPAPSHAACRLNRKTGGRRCACIDAVGHSSS